MQDLCELIVFLEIHEVSIAFACHDVKDKPVRGIHALAAYGGKVANALVNIIVDYSLA